MATTVTLNGTSYSVPATQDSGWGPSLSSYLIALSSGVLTKSGGTFTLTADANFGATFGLISKYFTSASANPATAGVVRLANGDSVSFRNSGNTADLALKPSSTDGILQYNSVDLANISSSQTLTNKTIDGNSNTISNVSDSALGTSYVKADGSRPLTANWAAGAFSITANGAVVGSAANTVSGVSTLVNGTGTLTLPTTTDTLVGRDTTDTLTNKTISGSSNTISNIGDSALSTAYIKADGSRALTGNWSAGAFSITANGVVLGSAAGTVSGLATIINGTGTLTLPTTTDTIVGRATTDSLTNKTLVAGSTAVADGVDATKKLAFTVSGNTTGVTTTIAAQNSADSTLSLPAVTTDTLVSRTSTDTGTSRLKNKDVEAGTFAVVDGTDTTKKILFDASSNTTGHTLTLKTAQLSSKNLYFPDSSLDGDSLIARQSSDTGTNRLKKKDLDSSTVKFADSTDPTKIVKFDISGNGAAQVTTIASQSSTARTITLPDATDTLVAQSTTDTLTNKTFGDAPTFTQVATPATPSSGFNKIYPKSDGKFYTLDSNGIETVVGSGSGGGSKNYITDGDFENLATTGWSLAHTALSIDGLKTPTSTATAGTAFSASSGGTAATHLGLSVLKNQSVATTGTLTNAEVAITNVANMTGVALGMQVSCATSGFPSNAVVTGISGTTVYINKQFTGTTASLQSITFSSTPLAGNASISLGTNYTGSAGVSTGSTEGDMMISDACAIDLEGQAKVLGIKFYYQNPVGTSLKFSGDVSNTHAVYIYDVTNGAWIQPAGVYNLVQGSGVGVYTGTFQTPSNMTEFQLAIININGTGVNTGFAVYLDDFSVGPQTTVNAPAMSDWNNATSTIGTSGWGGLGTVTVNGYYWKQVGDSIFVETNIVSGTVAASLATIPLPSGKSIDTGKIFATTSGSSSCPMVGTWTANGANQAGTLVAAASTNANVIYAGLMSAGGMTPANGNAIVSSSSNITFKFSVPIVGWSSNTVQSADTDTRVCAFSANTSTPGSQTSSGSFQKIAPTSWTILDDSHGAYDSTNKRYVIQSSGRYRISANVGFAASGTGQRIIGIYKNGSQLAIGSRIPGSASVETDCTISFQTVFVAGDYVEIFAFQDSGGTLAYAANATDNWWTMERLSGTAVVQASEKVYLQYTGNAGTALTANTTDIDWSTKVVDSHSAWNGTQFKAPRPGFYIFEGNIFLTASSATDYNAYVNGTQQLRLSVSETTSAKHISGSVYLVTGDLLSVRSDTNATLSNNSLVHWISIHSQG